MNGQGNATRAGSLGRGVSLFGAAVCLAVIGATPAFAARWTAATPGQTIEAGKVTLQKVSTPFPLTASVHVTFPHAFASAPVVVVTQEVPQLDPYADSFVSTYKVTRTGFDFQRRNFKAEVWNEGVTVHWIAVGT